jgi:heme/copper-type cytochrome/quinol oxidase subunit 2
VSVPIVHEIPDSDSDEEIVDELVLSIWFVFFCVCFCAIVVVIFFCVFVLF